MYILSKLFTLLYLPEAIAIVLCKCSKSYNSSQNDFVKYLSRLKHVKFNLQLHQCLEIIIVCVSLHQRQRQLMSFYLKGALWGLFARFKRDNSSKSLEIQYF